MTQCNCPCILYSIPHLLLCIDSNFWTQCELDDGSSRPPPPLLIIGPGRDTFLAAISQFPGQQSPPPSPGRGCRRPQLCFSNSAHWFWLGRGDGRTTLHCLRVGAAADPDAISLTRPNVSRQRLGRYAAPFTPGLS